MVVTERLLQNRIYWSRHGHKNKNKNIFNITDQRCCIKLRCYGNITFCTWKSPSKKEQFHFLSHSPHIFKLCTLITQFTSSYYAKMRAFPPGFLNPPPSRRGTISRVSPSKLIHGNFSSGKELPFTGATCAQCVG